MMAVRKSLGTRHEAPIWLFGVRGAVRSMALVCAVTVAATVAPNPVLSGGGPQPRLDHAAWDRILKRYVDEEGRVAYGDLEANGRDELDRYLSQLGNADLAGATEADRIAFWINAYNAAVVAAVVRGYSPESRLSRLKLFRWYKFPVAGKDRTLHEIEHEILRKRFREPRIHFALVCASTSCPKLRREAYRGEDLDRQLDDQARRFVNDPRRNQIDAATGVVELSSIFEWFAEDFAAAAGSVGEFVAWYVDSPAEAALLRRQGEDLRFLVYDWTLNKQTAGLGSSSHQGKSGNRRVCPPGGDGAAKPSGRPQAVQGGCGGVSLLHLRRRLGFV